MGKSDEEEGERERERPGGSFSSPHSCVPCITTTHLPSSQPLHTRPSSVTPTHTRHPTTPESLEPPMTSLFGGGGRSAAPQGVPDQARLAERHGTRGRQRLVHPHRLELPPKVHLDPLRRTRTQQGRERLRRSVSPPLSLSCERTPLMLTLPHLPHRCVAKYFAVNEKVQERLQAAQAGGQRVGM